MLKKVGGIKTLFPADMKLKCLAVPNILELRDDLLSPEEMTSFLSADFNSEWMLSCRTKKLTVFKDVEKILSKINWVDQPVENKLTEDIFENKKIIFSSHQDNMLAGINELSGQTSAHLKLSPLVLHWEELWQGHQWQQMDPQNRSFLPRSIEGRWKWYRLYQKGRQELNFWYESQSSAPDQPSLVEWLLQPDKTTSFAAVLGSPVQQSLSPMMHLDFFKKQNCCFFAIDLQEDEWDEALPILQSLGLKAAAVTSPLKMRAFQSCLVKSDSAKDLKAVNTLAWDQKLKSWQGENTDFLGFTEFVKDQKKLSSCVIWGGYGVLSMLQKVLPESSAYSARLASPKEGNREIVSPSVVIWAAPTRVGIVYPPKYWEPEVVIDLNYAENSWGRQYALQSNARYISGLNFFRSQALHQQSFWHRLVDFAFSEDNH